MCTGYVLCFPSKDVDLHLISRAQGWRPSSRRRELHKVCNISVEWTKDSDIEQPYPDDNKMAVLLSLTALTKTSAMTVFTPQ